MLPDRVSNPGPLTYESGALPIALRGPAAIGVNVIFVCVGFSTLCGFFSELISVVYCVSFGESIVLNSCCW